MSDDNPQDPGRVIEIPDQPGGRAAGQAEPDASGDAPEGKSPYRNLLVPLVVVPALIVMVFVLVLAFFGTITGTEASPAQNVDRLLNGGANERTQAAFNLVRQVLEEWEAETAGGEVWDVDETLVPRLRRAWEDTRDMEGPGDVPIPLALGILLAQLGEEQGASRLASMTRLSAELDPTGEYRAYAGFSLGAVGPRLDAAGQRVAREALVALLDEEDQGLRMVGVIGLQTLPAPETVAVLRGCLAERALEVRGNAALSLARLGDDAGRDVLRSMLREEAYREEHDREDRKWAKGRLISESRRKALSALAAIDALPELSELRRLAEDDPDPGVRELARELVAEHDAGAASKS